MYAYVSVPNNGIKILEQRKKIRKQKCIKLKGENTR